jgi:hypothetical protein
VAPNAARHGAAARPDGNTADTAGSIAGGSRSGTTPRCILKSVSVRPVRSGVRVCGACLYAGTRLPLVTSRAQGATGQVSAGRWPERKPGQYCQAVSAVLPEVARRASARAHTGETSTAPREDEAQTRRRDSLNAAPRKTRKALTNQVSSQSPSVSNASPSASRSRSMIVSSGANTGDVRPTTGPIDT